MNKTALITGCTTGIGKEVAIGLAKKGFNLLLISRDEKLLHDLKGDLITNYPQCRVEYFVCDFTQLKQVEKVSKLIEKAYTRLDVLINNAGVWEMKKQMTQDGFEKTWQVNYLAPFVLTENLMPLLLDTAKVSGDVRIINLASEAHRHPSKKSDGFTSFSLQGTYGATKMANVLHTFKLARALDGSRITVNCVHPGVVQSGLWRKFPRLLNWVLKRFMITPEEGAKTVLLLATINRLVATGKYFAESKIKEPSESVKNVTLQDQFYTFTKKKLAAFLR